MANTAIWKAQQTPGFNYKIESADKITQPRILYAKIHQKAPEKKVVNRGKTPDCTTYQSLDAFKKTQREGHEINGVKIVPPDKGSKKISVAEQYAKSKKFVPGVGTYKNVEAAY